MFGNPLLCDCQLKEVWRWCEDHNIKTAPHIEDLKCYSPIKGHVMSLWQLEELQCVQDNISNKIKYERKHNKLPNKEHKSSLTNVTMIHVLKLVYLFLSIIGTIDNIIILNIIIHNKDMRTVSNMYILNLVISDLIFLTLKTPISITSHRTLH